MTYAASWKGVMESDICGASRKNRHRKRHGILYLTMVYNIGMSAIHFTYLLTAIHVPASMYRQPCVVTHTVTVTVCNDGALRCVTVCYSGALRCCVTRMRYTGYVYQWCVTVRYKLKLKLKLKRKRKRKKEVGVVSGRVSQLVSILKTTDILCINITKITTNIEYLIHRMLNNNK